MNPKSKSKYGLALAAILAASPSIHATPVIYEPFDYAAGGLNDQGGTSDFGFAGNWSANGTSLVSDTNLLYGALATTGGSIGGLAGSINRFGGARTPTAAALAESGLLDDGATLWFSVIVGYETGANNTRLGFALANSSFNTGNNQYYINDEGAQLGAGVGFSLSGNTNGVVSASHFRDLASGTTTSGIVNGNTSATIVSNGNPPRLLVGSLAWGETEDVITIYAPNTSLELGSAISTLTVDVDQSTFDTITWARGDRIMMDEIRFGATSADVMPVSTVVPSLLTIEDNQGGGTIYEDIEVITYTLTFDQDMDPASITEDDFDNAGDAIISIGTITRPASGTIHVQVLPESTGTLQLRIPSGSVLSSFVPLNVDTTDPILDPTIITILAGSTPESGIRYWDGAITSGVTDGVSQGGNGTWNTTNTNWDKGVGFAGPVAWDNANLDTAILGGSNGTITLGEAITAGGIASSSTYTISGANTLTLDVASGTPVVNVSANTLTINSQISGTKGLEKTGAGVIRFSTTNTTHDYSGGFTLSQGQLNVEGQGSNDSFLGTGVFTIDGALSPIIRMSRSTGVAWTSNNDCIFTGGTILFTRPSGDAPKWQNNGNVTLQGDVTTNRSGVIGYGIIFNGDINDGGNGYSLSFNGLNNNRTEITLAGNNTYSGGTSLSDGANLYLNSSGALGLGSLTVTNLVLDNTSGGPVTIGNSNPINLNGNPTFIGSNDLNLGTGAVTMNNNRTVTVNGGTLTVGGAIGGGNRTLTKAGAGTLVLSGANSYSNTTTVSAGTLALVGGSQDSAITVNSGASLGFTLGSPTTSSKAVTLNAGHSIIITGTVNNVSDYQLITATEFTGIPTLSAAITGYELELREGDTELWLASTSTSASPYDTWASINAPTGTPADDFDGDGVSNAIEFVLGGDKDTNDLDKLPVVATTATDMTFTFVRDQASVNASVGVEIKVSTDLVDWSNTYTVGADTAASTAGVTVTDNTDGTDTITLTVTKAPDDKKFARLMVTITP